MSGTEEDIRAELGTEQNFRHLKPSNLSPLRRKMKKQLENLKGVNAQGFPLPPYEHKAGGRHLYNIFVSKDEA